VQLHAQSAESLATKTGKDLRTGRRRRIGSVIRSPARELQARDVAQIRQRGGGRELIDELGKGFAVQHHERRGWRPRRGIDARHGAEEFVADQATDHRETLRERIDESGDHVVAVNGESAVGFAPRPGSSPVPRVLHRAERRQRHSGHRPVDP
jgi:hypothetical protein